MYWLLLILRELRRLFSNKTFKMGFTIAILFFAVTSFMAWLPSSKADASTRIDIVMTSGWGTVGKGAVGGYGITNTMGTPNEQYFYYDYSYSASDTYSPYSAGQDNVSPCFIFACSGGTQYTITHSGSFTALAVYTDTLTNAGHGIGVAYQGNLTNVSTYYLTAPADGFIILYCPGWTSVENNPFTCYYMYDSEVTQQDIETSTNTTTNTIISESQETRNTITDSNVDNTVVDMLPEDTFTNPYESNVDSIFTRIYNAFTLSSGYESVTITIPFTNKTITINSKTVFNDWFALNGGFLPYALRVLIRTFWYYVFGRFIIIDVLSIIEKIKNGKLDKIEESNVKEDML